jgi:excisionase family DNA binding protein
MLLGNDERPQPLTVKEVAAELRRHPVTIRSMLDRGVIPGTKIGNRWYIQREALDRLLAGERP